MDVEAIWLSLQLAALTTAVLLLAGLPLAYWLAVTRWRLKFLLEAIVVLPMILPPTVLGFYILIALGPLSPIGRAYEAVAGKSLAFSFEGLLLASILYSLPFAVRPFTAAFVGVGPAADGGFLVSWRLASAHLLPRRLSALVGRDSHWRDLELCPHAR